MVGWAWARGPGAGAAGLRAGAAVSDISPTAYPVIVNAMFTERTATNTVDRLHARALVLDDGRTRLAVCIVDTCMMSRDLIDRAKVLARESTGIPVDRMLVSATHTHSAPSAMGCLGSRQDPVYAAGLPSGIAAAITEAARRLQPARVGWAVVDDWDHTFNRRWIRRPDRLLVDPFGSASVRAHMHPGYQSPDAIGPSGPVDPGLSILAVETRDGRPLALLANYSQHYYGSPLLSSDYFGRFVRHVAARLGVEPDGEFVGMMSQGTSGDLMWMDYGAPARDIGYDAYAREVADRAVSAYRQVKWRMSVPLGMAEATLPLAYRVPDAERLAWARRVAGELGDRLPRTLPEVYALEALYLHERPRTELVLQALRIGPLGITAIPNEVFALTGLKLKAWSPLRPTFNIELANGAEGYIPPPEQHALGGYTTWPARTAGLEVEAEPRIVEGLLDLLEKVSGRGRRPAAPEHGPYARAVLRDRPQAYWRLEDLAGPVARDVTRHRRHAVIEKGVALYLPGAGAGSGVSPHPALVATPFSGSAVNRSMHFAGGRLRADVALGDSFTVEFWVWNGLPPETRIVAGHLLAVEREGEGGGFEPGRAEVVGIAGVGHPDGLGRLFVADDGPGARTAVGKRSLGLKQWHHVVWVRRPESDRLYLDGELDFEARRESGVGGTWTRVVMGGRPDADSGLEGRLDEVAVYSRALDSEVVARHFRTAKPKPSRRPD